MKRTAVVVPEFNERSRSDLAARLDYFARLAAGHRDRLDVIIVDDASTDGSREALERYVKERSPAFTALYMQQNGHKIGAIKAAVRSASAGIDTILLTDFDSSIPESSMARFGEMVEALHSEQNLGGFALRVDGENTDSMLGYIQNLEYVIGRAFDGVARSERKTRCIAGAGGLWKRSVLEEVFPEHSGRHNGDDMELTAMAMRHGYSLSSYPEFVVNTKTPETFGILLKQRTRWELGALETYAKEWKFFGKTALSSFKLKRFGLLTSLQIGVFAALPFSEYVGIKSGIDKSWEYFALYYGTDLGFLSTMAFLARKEIKKDARFFLAMPLMPLYRIATIYPSRTRAVLAHTRNVMDDTALCAYMRSHEAFGYFSNSAQGMFERVSLAAKRTVAGLATLV